MYNFVCCNAKNGTYFSYLDRFNILIHFNNIFAVLDPTDLMTREDNNANTNVQGCDDPGNVWTFQMV